MQRYLLHVVSAVFSAFLLLASPAHGQFTFEPDEDQTVEVLAGQPVTLTFAVTGSPMFVYWQKYDAVGDGWEAVMNLPDAATRFSGFNTSSLTIRAEEDGSTTGRYRLVARASLSDVGESSPEYTVASRAPDYTWTPGSNTAQTVLQGQSLSLGFSVDTNGHNPQFRWQRFNATTSQWEVLGAVIPALEDAPADPIEIALTIPAITANQAGRYRLQGSHVVGQWETSPEVLVTVNQYTLVVQPATQTLLNNNGGVVPVFLAANQTIGYTVTRAGGSLNGTQYQWQKRPAGSTDEGDWETIAGATTASLALTNIQLSNNGQYRLRVRFGADGIWETAPAVIPVSVVPRIQTQPAPALTTRRVGESFVAQVAVAAGQGPVSYIWYHSQVETNPVVSDWIPLSGQSADVLVLTNLQINQTGLYRVRIINELGNSTFSNSIRLTVNPPNMAPRITQQPEPPAEILPWQTITLNVVATGFPNPTFVWQRQNPITEAWANVSNAVGKIEGATTAQLTIRFAVPTDTGTYRVRVSNSQGIVESEPVAIAVWYAPLITAQPEDVRDNNLAGSIAMNVIAIGVPTTLDYQWQKWDGGEWRDLDEEAPWTGTDTADLAIEKEHANASGQYRVRISNDAGTVHSRVATVTIGDGASQNTAPRFLVQPQPAVGELGGWVIFSAVAVGSPIPTLQWQFSNDNGDNWDAISGETRQDLVVANLTAGLAGLYRLVASNAAGTVESSAVALTLGVSSTRWGGALAIEDSGWYTFGATTDDLGWFDIFFMDPANPDTIFHATHGWLYVQGDDITADPGLWFWSNDLGWFNTWEGLYPDMFFVNHGWLRYIEFTENPRWFFDIANGVWLMDSE